MQREKFPEKVPFRLTRMLVNAMEVKACSLTASFLIVLLLFLPLSSSSLVLVLVLLP